MSSVSLSYNTSLHPSHLLRARYGSGRISFPVRPNQAIYAHFKHVSGVPAADQNGGLSLSRLKSIDTLIDRLVQLKQSAGSGRERAEIQRMIESLEGKVKESGGRVAETVTKHANSLHSLTEQGGVGYAAPPAMDAALFSLSA
jgi:hypothetical protein